MKNLKKYLVIVSLLTILIAGFFISNACTQSHAKKVVLPTTFHPATDAYEGWRLGSQAYTFNRFTFFEAIDKVDSLNLDWIEAYPGQRFSPEKPDENFNHSMSAELRVEAKQKLKEAGIVLANYGVVGLPNDEAECRKVFDFAKDMGIQTIVSEPPEDTFDLIEKLCEEYQIRVAIHNHPKPSRYWNPETVLKVCEGRSKLIGSCGDTGHWMRSGVNPMEAVKMLEGRLISMHLKDLNEFGIREAHDVIWGTGKANMEAILNELHRQKFQGVFSIEYEHNWLNSLPEVKGCVAFFNKVGSQLNPSGWNNLFADDLSNAKFKPGAWTVEDGVLTWHGGGYIWTNERYGDFILDLEYMVTEGANSGIFFRAFDLNNVVHTAIEVQIHETTDGAKYGMCGAVYDCMAPSKNVAKKAGLWNHFTITCKANKIYVVLNGEQIIDMDLDLWTEAHKNPDGTKNKFEIAYKDMAREGHIGFQDHGNPLWFRNLKIKKL
jgi:sugar phosphate isomerase/epimerase